MSVDRAAEIIIHGQLYFAHPTTWEDPYEGVLQHKRARAIFAQCWCRKAVSDAMWRIYSPHGLGVRIGTTDQRLKRAPAKAKVEKKIISSIKDVEYLFQKKLDAKLSRSRDRLAAKYSFENAAAPLFLKRKAFDHERETRVFVYDPACLDGETKRGIAIDVEPLEVLTSIWIDPRAPDALVNA